jgi:hypothetical protein
MPKHLANLARRVEGDPFFLACPLAHFARSEGLNEEGLAVRFGCSLESLALVRLCRTPTAESESFHDDVARIADKFSISADVLADAVRRGQAIFHMTAGSESKRTLLAARDSDAEHNADFMTGGDS